MAQESPLLLSYKEASILLGLNLNTLYAMVNQRRIPHIRLSARSVWFKRSQLLDWLTAHEVPMRKDGLL